MKKVLFTLLLVLGVFFANAQVVINNGVKDVDNNSTYVATPESLSSEKIVAKFKLVNKNSNAEDFSISADKVSGIEGSTYEILIDGVVYDGVSTSIGANATKDIEFVVNSPEFGATNMKYTIKCRVDYVFNIDFYYTSLNFAESHHDTAGDNLNSTQSAGLVWVPINADNSSTIYFNFKNIGASANYYLKQSFVKSVDGFDNMICMPGQCVPGNATPAFNINGGETIEETYKSFEGGMDVICYPNGNIGHALIRYALVKGSKDAPTADSISWVVKYESFSSVNDKPAANNAKFSNVYPNPVKNTININCSGVDGVAMMTIYNMTGAKVMEYEADTYSGKISFNVADLKNGLYLYSISLNGKTVESKKFVINR